MEKYFWYQSDTTLSFWPPHFFEVSGESNVYFWGPDIWLAEAMVKITKWRQHKNGYAHFIIYTGLYIYPWYWKFTQLQARQQSPRPRVRGKNYESEGRDLLTVETLKYLSKFVEWTIWRMNPTHFVPKSKNQEFTVTN